MEEECGDGRGPLDAHLRFHRRINLAGLLQRLDTATMLESVEGRTPFADRCVAELAESLPMSMKFDAGVEGSPAGTKLALRRAFAGILPREVVERPKASFPLPFQEWVVDRASALRESGFAREVFSTAAVELVAADPARNWRLAWPMINLAMWGARWW
jgi:asparagine synthase (glutamine-hydrolysing)